MWTRCATVRTGIDCKPRICDVKNYIVGEPAPETRAAGFLILGPGDLVDQGVGTMALRMLRPAIGTLDTRSAKPAPKTADSFYLSPEWRKLVASLIEARGRRCEAPDCGRSNCRIFGDHVRELADGGAPLDPDNVRLLCGSCHTRKTIAARARRMARPIEPASPAPLDQ